MSRTMKTLPSPAHVRKCTALYHIKSYAACILCLLLICTGWALPAQTPQEIEVDFLYGSRPRHAYRKVERRWFGGKMGGHVGIAYRADSVISFVPAGKFHWFSRGRARHSRFIVQSERAFWEIFGTPADSVQWLRVRIPLTELQAAQLERVAGAYLRQSPYDYALVGMRCAAATADILADIDVLPRLSPRKFARTFYKPRVLRRHMVYLAEQNGWQMDFRAGSSRRSWERW
jgi:hypothetical protein